MSYARMATIPYDHRTLELPHWKLPSPNSPLRHHPSWILESLYSKIATLISLRVTPWLLAFRFLTIAHLWRVPGAWIDFLVPSHYDLTTAWRNSALVLTMHPGARIAFGDGAFFLYLALEAFVLHSDGPSLPQVDYQTWKEPYNSTTLCPSFY